MVAFSEAVHEGKDEIRGDLLDGAITFIGKNLKDLNLRAKYNVHIIAIKELVPENFTLVPPASFVIKNSDILIMLGKTEDIRRIKAFK